MSFEALRHLLGKLITRPLLQFRDGTVMTNPRFFKKAYEGYGFIASHRFTAVGTDESRIVYFENPVTSGREVTNVAVLITVTSKAYIDVYKNNTEITSGTKITPTNLNFGSSIEPKAVVKYGGSYSFGQKVREPVAPGGTGVRAVGSLVEVGENITMPPGTNIAVVITNPNNQAIDISVDIIWFEEVI